LRRSGPRLRALLIVAGALAALTASVGAPAVRGDSRVSADPLNAPEYVSGWGGAVSSAEPEATRVGVRILRARGNAVDAAVAVALALAVVHPQAGNLGGGGFAVVRTDGSTTALDFRETAPAASRRDMFLGPDGRPREGSSWVGPLAAGVPGSPAGLYELQRRFGRIPWKDVVAPAVRLAREGFEVSRRLHDAIEEEKDLLAKFPETAAVWLPGGKVPAAGASFRLPELGRTLAAYAAGGPGALTAGPIAEAIVSASRARGGILTAADLAGYRPAWRAPLRFGAFGWQVAAMPLPSSGGTITAETFAILERLGWASLPRSGVDRDHLLAEAWRRAYADRFALGEPSASSATSEQLLDGEWIRSRAAGIDRDRATPSLEVRPWPGTAPGMVSPGAGESPQTTHLSVVDASGTVVSLTTTLNGWFGCGLYVERAGFLLNNEMDDFTTAPGLPNAYGLVQGEANAVHPGRRMLSSMNPMIAWRGGESMAIGSRGGSRIPTSTIQVFLDLAVDGLPLREAVERPRIHHQWLPDQITIEAGALEAGLQTALEKRGHLIRTTDWIIGEVDVVRRRGESVEAEADPRGPGGAGVTGPAALRSR
jgi:gamma-glutamyltranspeptidase / glutathione hydrolase